MEDTKTNQGPEFPADLQWSQGAKNPRKLNETKIDLGMLSSETTDQIVEAHTETPIGDISTEPKIGIPSFLDNFEGTKNDKYKRIRECCLEIVKSNEYVHQKCLSNPFVVVIMDISNPKAIIEEEDSIKIIELLSNIIANLTDIVSPKFDDFELKDGLIMINCYNSETVFWLRKTVALDLKVAAKKNLRTVSKFDFSNLSRVSAFLPGARKKYPQIRTLLYGPNLSLQWTVITIFKTLPERDGSGLNVLFQVNERAFEELNNLSMKPYFGLSRGEFHTCSTFEEWASRVVMKSYPRTTLASQFHCRNFGRRAEAVNKRIEVKQTKKELKKQKRLDEQKHRLDEQKHRLDEQKKHLDEQKNSLDKQKQMSAVGHSSITSKKPIETNLKKKSKKRRRRKPKDKKNEETKESQQTKTTATSTSPEKIQKKIDKDRKMKKFNFNDRSRRFLDNQRHIRMRGLNQPKTLGVKPVQPQSPNSTLRKLSQISKLLDQLKASNVLSNNERIDQSLRYNKEQLPTFPQLSERHYDRPSRTDGYSSSSLQQSHYDNYFQYSESRNDRNQNYYDFRSSRERSPLPSLSRDGWKYPTSRDDWKYPASSDDWRYSRSIDDWKYPPSRDGWKDTPSRGDVHNFSNSKNLSRDTVPRSSNSSSLIPQSVNDNYFQYSESRNYRDQNNYDFPSSRERSPLPSLTRYDWKYTPSNVQNFNNSNNLHTDTEQRFSNYNSYRLDSTNPTTNYSYRNKQFDPPRQY